MKFSILSILGLSALALADELKIDTTHAVECSRKSKSGDFISVHYSGSLEDGTVFDASYNRGQPITFQLGIGQVISGWDQGLLDMCIGEKRTLTIPSDLAYGDSGVGPIPPKAVLSMYNVEQQELVDCLIFCSRFLSNCVF